MLEQNAECPKPTVCVVRYTGSLCGRLQNVVQPCEKEIRKESLKGKTNLKFAHPHYKMHDQKLVNTAEGVKQRRVVAILCMQLQYNFFKVSSDGLRTKSYEPTQQKKIL